MNAIEVKNLVFSYDQERNVINDVSFNLEKGTYTTIIGHNGSGKSTIAKLLIGLMESKSGSITIDGINLTPETVNQIRRKIGIVFQNPDNQFIGATVRDDIAFGLENHEIEPKDMDSIIEKYAEEVNMTPYLESEPTKLSGGQKQRVAIAGVLAMAPDIIIFDEATSMLDPIGREEINALITKLHKEKNLTIISITHDIEEVVSSDNVLVMNKGKLVLSGTPDVVLRMEKELIDLSLDIPFAYKLSKALNKAGVKIKDEINLERLVDGICQSNLKK